MRGGRIFGGCVLAALVCAGCPYILGVEGEFSAESSSTITGGSVTTAGGAGGMGTGGPGGSGGAGGGSAGGGGSGGSGGGGDGPITLAPDQPGADGITIHGDNVYWIVTPGAGPTEVRTIARTGSPPPPATIFTQPELREIGVFTTATATLLAAASQTQLYRRSLADPPGVFDMWNATRIGGLDVISEGIYYTDQGIVYRVRHNDTGPFEFQDDAPNVLADIAANSVNAYWTLGSGIRWQGHGGGQAQNIAAPGDGRIAVNEEHVCCTAPNAILCWSSDAVMPAMPLLSVTTTDSPSSVALHGTHVYWTERDGNRVKRASLPDGAEDTLSDAEVGPSSIAVDGEFIFWTNRSAGQVRRMPLPQ